MARPIDYKRQCKQLENKITRLKKAGRDIEKEMVQRGKEITNMIHIFLANEQDWPEEQRDEFRRVAVGYACRCDKKTKICVTGGQSSSLKPARATISIERHYNPAHNSNILEQINESIGSV